MSDSAGPPPKPSEPPSRGRPLRLEPFRAWRFVASKVSALGAVTSPPYDVLEPGMVRRLTESDLHNMVRLILPRDPGLGGHRYDDAAARLRSWQRDGIVEQDGRPALYVYEQRRSDVTLCGLVGALGLDPTAEVVLPHEDVMPPWVDDRHLLMETTGADLEPILLAYAGGGATSAVSEAVDRARADVPWLHAQTDDGTAHRIWRIEAADTLARMAAQLAGQEALIADGHHRHAAYLRRLERHPGRSGVDLGLAMLVDHDRHPLTLDSIHRTLPGISLPAVAARTPAGWQAVPGEIDGVAHRAVLTDGANWLTVHRVAPSPVPDVALLHAELLPAWGVTQERVGYHHALADALALADANRLVVRLDPPRLYDVLSTAARGGRLPQKATSFGPKPRTGLLFRTLDVPEASPGHD